MVITIRKKCIVSIIVVLNLDFMFLNYLIGVSNDGQIVYWKYKGCISS